MLTFGVTQDLWPIHQPQPRPDILDLYPPSPDFFLSMHIICRHRPKQKCVFGALFVPRLLTIGDDDLWWCLHSMWPHQKPDTALLLILWHRRQLGAVATRVCDERDPLSFNFSLLLRNSFLSIIWSVPLTIQPDVWRKERLHPRGSFSILKQWHWRRRRGKKERRAGPKKKKPVWTGRKRRSLTWTPMLWFVIRKAWSW